MTAIDRLSAGKYLLLSTFRRDGRVVPTPVWVVRDGDELGVWTVTASGKVKRIRRNRQVTVAPCDIRGRPLGDAVRGEATVADADGTRRIQRLLMRKYGVLGWITIMGSRLRRGTDGTVGVRIRLID